MDKPSKSNVCFVGVGEIKERQDVGVQWPGTDSDEFDLVFAGRCRHEPGLKALLIERARSSQWRDSHECGDHQPIGVIAFPPQPKPSVSGITLA